MTKSQVINCLRRYRYERMASKGYTMPNIGALANCPPEWVKFLRDYGHVYSKASLARITRAVEMIENGEVRFVLHQPNLITVMKRRGGLVNARGEPRWRIEWVTVPKRRPYPQEKITPADAHASWARCRTCQGDRWTAIEMGGREWYACDKCVGPVHWPAMGALKINDKSRLALLESRLQEDFSFLREG